MTTQFLSLSPVVAPAAHRSLAPPRPADVRRRPRHSSTASCWSAAPGSVPFTPAVEISRSPLALPAYAGFSLLRISARLPPQPDLHARLRLHRRLQPAGRALHDSAARRPAVDPRAQLSARRDARHGRAVSRPPARRRTRRHPAHLHRASLEHGLQLLRLAEKHSARDARSRQDLPLQLVAALHRSRIALTPPSAWSGTP